MTSGHDFTRFYLLVINDQLVVTQKCLFGKMLLDFFSMNMAD